MTETKPLSGRRQKFCDGVVSGLTAAEAYRAAYPKAAPENARKNATRLMSDDEVKAEISRQRAEAEKIAGSSVLTCAEKRMFFARVVRAQVAKLSEDSDLWQSIKRTKEGVEYRLPDKLGAIKADNNLAGDGKEAEANDELTALLIRIRDGSGPPRQN